MSRCLPARSNEFFFIVIPMLDLEIYLLSNVRMDAASSAA